MKMVCGGGGRLVGGEGGEGFGRGGGNWKICLRKMCGQL